MIEPDPAQLNQVLRLEPDRQPPMIQRPVAEIADPQACDLEPVLVGIERAERFAERLADAITAVRPRRHIGADPVMPGIEADRIAAEMQDAVDAFADRLDLGDVGQLRRLEFFTAAEIGGRLEVAEQEVRIDRRQQFAQTGADSPRCAGHQYAWHFFPRLLTPPICGRWPGVIANQTARKRNNENSKCPMHRPMRLAGGRQVIIPIPPSTRSIPGSRNTGSNCRRWNGWPRGCAGPRARCGSATDAIFSAAISRTSASSSGRRKPAPLVSIASRRTSPTATPATARAGWSPANMVAAASSAPNMTARSRS